MEIVRKIKDVKALKLNESIGFVPTMGALHEGHLTLIRKAREENDHVVVSIFVNPMQFLPGEDFHAYPRREEGDIEILQNENVDILFMPEMAEIYKDDFSIHISFPYLTDCLCGLSRPGHFEGVAVVVGKLFNIVQPTNVYFGQKDYQQAVVVRQLIRDLNFPIKMNILPTVRDHRGLALSSRNSYLDKGQIDDAVSLHEMLVYAEKLIKNGERDVSKIKAQMLAFFNNKDVGINYVDVRRADNLKEIQFIDSGSFVLACSIFIGGTHLIDNILVNV